jgi:ADP-ribosyl-[dinitrogen reductase] hydrolase
MSGGIEPDSIEDRAVGALVGLAVGDALGTSVEFMSRGSFAPVTGMRGGGVFNLRPGEWTDDTSMALALAEALQQDRSLADPAFAMNRWVNWAYYGYYSHTGTCFDIGGQTSRALQTWHDLRRLPERDTENAGNGGIMRLAPAVIANLHDRAAATDVAQRQSDLTHRNKSCREIAGQMAGILHDLIHGVADDVVPPSIAGRVEEDVSSSGYVVDTFEAALWAFAPRDGFADIVLRTVNLGDDADSVGAVAGQLAGARYGMIAIPTDCLDALAWQDKIVESARKLFLTSQG